MSRDAAVLRASHETAASAVRPFLDAGQDVAMLNLGDVSIYATFGYLQEILQAQGYATAMAAAARLNQPLTGGMDAPLTIAPGSRADEVLDAPGTKVLMKTGRQLPALLDTLDAHGALSRSALVCSCGLPDETIFPDLSTARPPQDGSKAGYFATVLVKE
jgi:precorrin-2/cobalt-factor-2 C20-methyltransferase